MLSRRVILYVVRRYFGLGREEWDDLPWDIQETYLDGLSEDPDVSFSINRDETAAQQGVSAGSGPQVRENVDAGTNVIDLRAMIAELEADPEARRRR